MPSMFRWRKPRHARARRDARAGLTLIELIVAFSLLLILSTMALPLMQTRVQREKERRLRDSLEELRDAIDRYKDAADSGMLGQLDPDNHGYPESLDVLVEGVEVNSSGMGAMGMGMQPGMGGMQQPGMGGMQGGIGGMQGGIGGQSGFGQQGGFGNQGSSFGNRGGGQGGFGSNSRSSFGSSNSRSGRSGRSGTSAFGSGFGSDQEEDEEKKIRFLRRIPVDPITGQAEWGMRSVSDSPDSMSWGGGNVFDVFSLSMDTALDGTRYNEW